jgi:3-demethoxyubiquinol 3-hydroxylase
MAAQIDLSDQLLASADRALRALFAPARASRPTPGVPGAALQDRARGEAAALMRINHGQALVARDPSIRSLLETAAREENDHLAWCETRLQELGDRPSLLHPLWYVGSFALGVAAGLASDPVSLGFVAETERQVEKHLDSHLEQLPTEDSRSRAILERMRNDERTHGELAQKSGAVSLPDAVRWAMAATARVMTTTARWI